MRLKLQICSVDLESEFPISNRVQVYLEDILNDEIGKYTKMNKSHENIIIAIFQINHDRSEKEVSIKKGSKLVRNENTRVYEILLNTKNVCDIKNTHRQYEKLLLLYKEAILSFFSTHYKKMSSKRVNDNNDIFDLQYLKSIQYPSPTEERYQYE
jgi:hypothetical protein